MALTVKEYVKNDERGVLIGSKFFRIIAFAQLLFALGIIVYIATSVATDNPGVWIVGMIIILNFIFIFYGGKITLTRNLTNGNITLKEKILFKINKIEYTPSERPYLMLFNPLFNTKYTNNFYILAIVNEKKDKVTFVKSLNKKTPALWNFTRDQAVMAAGLLGLKLSDEMGVLSSGDFFNFTKKISNNKK